MPEGPSPRAELAGATVSQIAVAFVNFGLPTVGPELQREYGLRALFRVYPGSRRAWALAVRQMAVPLGGTVAAVAMPLLALAGALIAVRLPTPVAATER